MTPDKLKALVLKGTALKYPKGQIIYSLDYDEELYLINHGYVKRYSVAKLDLRSIQAIYGPEYFFPLTPMFKKLLNLHLSPDNTIYFYEAMTDVEVHRINVSKLTAALKTSPELYADLLYEAGRRLQSNIYRLESVGQKDDYQKVAHNIHWLASEFGETSGSGSKATIKIPVPLTVHDIAELLNLPTESVDKAMRKLTQQGAITFNDQHILVENTTVLHDAYL